MTTTHVLYGAAPRDLVHPPADAQQCSPLIPGAMALETCVPQSAASATIAAPGGTIERRYTLARALQALTIGAPLTAFAPKDKGGRRIAAELEQFGCTVHEEPRSHMRLCTTTRPSALNDDAIAQALTEGGPQQHPNHGIWTQPGIFSWDRLDAGSALLLKHLPTFTGRGADLGCGLGLLSLAALQSPTVTELTLIDIDRRAIAAATRNIHDPRAKFEWKDIRHDTLNLTALDFIVMNPPFHDTGIEDKSLGQTFIERAASLLKPGGTCWLTANRHLPYEALLTTRFTRSELIAEADGFKIYMAEK